MKQKLKSFLSKHRLILIIAFLLIGTLFAYPITVYSSDTEYVTQTRIMLPIAGSSGGAEFTFPSQEESDGSELVMFTERGYVGPGGRVTQQTEGRLTKEEIENLRRAATMWYAYPDPVMLDYYHYDREPGELDYTDYIGFIIKKDGFVVSASLYKVYGFTPYYSGMIEEVCHVNFPFLNCFVTETHAKSELRRIALFDRILTLDSFVNQQNSPHWEEYTP